MGRHGLFTAEQIASRFSLTVETVSEYAKRGLLRPITLSDGIFFNASDFTRLEVVIKGRRLGFSLSEIKLLIDGVRKPAQEIPLD